MDTTLTVLGSGTLLPGGSRHSAAHLLEGSDASVLLDCGSGTLHGLDLHGVPWTALTHVLITHYHNDHVGDLAALLFALKWERGGRAGRPLTVVGPPGFTRFLERLAAALGPHVLDPGFPLVVHEVDLGAGMVGVDGVMIASVSTPHTDDSIAFRVELGGASVGYTGDTGPSPSVAELMKGCGAVVAECAQADPPEMDTHLSPSSLAAMARVAEPGVLVVTHVYPPLTPDGAVRQVQAEWPGQVVEGRDGLKITVPTNWATQPRSGP